MIVQRIGRRFLLGMVGLMLASIGFAQSSVAPEIGVGLLFNQTDVMMDFGAGVSFQNIGLSTKISFQSRISTKRVLVETDQPNLLYQFHERRYLLGLDADKRFTLTDLSENVSLGLFLGGFAGMTFNDYRGTDEKGSVGFGWEAKGGLFISNSEIFVMRLGYTYLPLPTRNVYPHRIGISFHFLITDAI